MFEIETTCSVHTSLSSTALIEPNNINHSNTGLEHALVPSSSHKFEALHSSKSANTLGGSYERCSEDLAQDKFIDRLNVYFFDTVECWRQQGWPHRGLGLGLAEGLGLGSAEAMQGNLQGCQCFLTSSTTIEDSAALLSHSKKASGLLVA